MSPRTVLTALCSSLPARVRNRCPPVHRRTLPGVLRSPRTCANRQRMRPGSGGSPQGGVPSASIANLRPPGSVPLVYKLCQRNEVPSLRTGGALRFHQDAVESFLALNPAPHYAPVEPRCSASSWSIELYPPVACG